MPSQFFGLNIAYSGLLASNAALNTTSNNIANVQTDGYSRQQVVQQAANALRVFQTYGCAGAGVETLAIERVRDEFYDVKYWNNNAKVGEYEFKQYYMRQIEDYFQDDSTVPGFKTIYDQMVNGLQEVLKNAGSASTKSQFIGFAQSLAEYFNNLSGNLKELQKDVNQEIKIKVDEINSIAAEIATLDKQINVIEMGGGTANELRDRRSLLIDQLSEIVDVEVQEVPIKDPNNPDRETGATRYIVTIAGGQTLVDGNEYRGLECKAREIYEKVNQTDIDGLYDVYWEDGQTFNLYSGALGGALKGLVEMRDGNNEEGFTGTVIDTDKKTVTDENGNTVIKDTVTIEVGKDYLVDLNKCNLSDSGGRITLGNQVFYYDSWSYTRTKDAAGNETTTYTFTLSNEPSKNPRPVTNDRVGTVASIGPSLDYQGIPYYMRQMNEWVRVFSQNVNDILANGYNAYGDHGSNLFTADMATDKDQYDFNAANVPRYDWELANGTSVTVDVSDSSYYWMTAHNFNVLAAMAKDADLLATRNVQSNGADDYSTMTDLDKMLSDKRIFRNSTSGEFLERILSDVALNANRANTFLTNYQNIGNSINVQRLSIYGVDEDEEAVNLVKYQNGYNLAAKMIQTLTEIYDKLILDTGV